MRAHATLVKMKTVSFNKILRKHFKIRVRYNMLASLWYCVEAVNIIEAMMKNRNLRSATIQKNTQINLLLSVRFTKE